MKRTHVIMALFLGLVLLPMSSMARAVETHAEWGVAEDETYKWTVGLRLEYTIPDEVFDAYDEMVDAQMEAMFEGSGEDAPAGMDTKAILDAVIAEINANVYHVAFEVTTIESVDEDVENYQPFDMDMIGGDFTAKGQDETSYSDLDDFVEDQANAWADVVLEALPADYADFADQAIEDAEVLPIEIDAPEAGKDAVVAVFADIEDLDDYPSVKGLLSVMFVGVPPLFVPTTTDLATDWTNGKAALDEQLGEVAEEQDLPFATVDEAMTYAGISELDIQAKSVSLKWDAAAMDDEILDMVEGQLEAIETETGMVVADPYGAYQFNLKWDDNGVLENYHQEGLMSVSVDEDVYQLKVTFDISSGENADINAKFGKPGLEVPGYPMEILGLIGALTVAGLLIRSKKQ